MAVRVQKSAVNIREKLAELERPIGINGAALMATNTPQEAFSLIGDGRKNMIINGDMRIDQRNNGSAITTPNVGIAVDRWKCATYVTGTTIQRSTTAPPGFSHSYLMTNGTAIAPAQSTYYQQIWQIIEGFNITRLGWGTSSAKPISISFWVRSSAPGLYSFGLGNGDSPSNSNNNRSFCQTFSISSANTWEYKTFTIPGCPSGTWATDNTYGVTIAFNLGSGTAYDTNSPGVWSSSSTYMQNSTSSTIEFNNITGATFYLTGVQLEEGKVATPFEYRSYGQELALCQRYYEKSFPDNVTPAKGSTTTSLASGGQPTTTLDWNATFTAGTLATHHRFKVDKRGIATMTFYGTSNDKCIFFDFGTKALIYPGFAIDSITRAGFRSYNDSVGLTNNSSWGVDSFNWVADAEL